MSTSFDALPGPRPWTQSPWIALGAAAALAVVLGLLSAVVNPLLVLGAMVALLGVAAIFWRPVLGVFAFVGVVSTLPFGVIPVRVGVQLTFVDALLIITFASFALRLPSLAREGGLRIGTQGGFVLAWVLVAILALFAGSGASMPSADVLRRVGKLLAGFLFFLVVLNLIRERSTVTWMVRCLILGGALSGAAGTVLWLLPPPTQLRLLSALQIVGYPTNDVLRYIPGANNTYTDQLRATGTSVDPNVFGGTLMVVLALIAMQWLAKERVLPRPILLLAALPVLSGMLLSFSRSSWAGFAIGVLLIASLRERRIWWLVPLGAIVLLAVPQGRGLIERFVSGLSTDDPATALRFGEYRNALTLIGRYPLLGIGFGPSPDIDVTAGVSSIYLLVAERTGLIGLAVYLSALFSVGGAALARLRNPLDSRTYGLVAAGSAALLAAFTSGLADHYWANPDFPHAVSLFWLYAAVTLSAARLAVPEQPSPSYSPSISTGSISSASENPNTRP